jgi:SAM-dependent methyltransferase
MQTIARCSGGGVTLVLLSALTSDFDRAVCGIRPTERTGTEMVALKQKDNSILAASDAWLRNHCVSKSPRRFQHILTLPIRKGDHVLDLCCGTGLYTELFALMAGPTGHVVGLDRNEGHISLARGRAKQHIMSGQLSYARWDAASEKWPTILREKRVDVIVIFSGLCYLSDPLTKVL